MSGTPDEVTRCVAAVLGIPAGEIPVDRPLQEIGLESFAAVRLHRRIGERTGIRIPLNNFLGATARTLATEVGTRRGNHIPDRAVDTVDGCGDEASHPNLSETEAPATDAPLTPIQAAYWVGREPELPLGGVATFYYHEYDRCPGDQMATDPMAEVRLLEEAWNRVVAHHPMLRAVITDDGRQRVLDSVDRYRIGVTDLRHMTYEDIQSQLDRLRTEKSHQVRPSGTWPLFDVHTALLPDGTIRVFLGFDILVLDMAGWIQLIRHWGQVVTDPSAELPRAEHEFLDLVRQRDSPEALRRWERDRAYWLDKLPTLPAGPALPVDADLTQLRKPRFRRHESRLCPEHWISLVDRAAARGLSPTGLLMAAYGLTLSRWGSGAEQCLNTTLFDRTDEQDPRSSVVGDFSSTVLVALPGLNPAAWQGFEAYAADVNARFWTDLEHRGFSGVEVQRAQGQTLVPRYPCVFTSGVGLGQASEPAARWLGTEVFGVSQTPQVLLDHIVWDEAGELRIAWDAVDEAFPDGFVDGMLDAHTRLLRLLATDETAWRRTDLGWDPSFRLPEPRIETAGCGPLLADPQRKAGTEQPDRPAVFGQASTVSHGELASRAEALADALVSMGVRANDLVGVALPKSPAQIVAAYAVLACGAAFVPIEPDWPPPRTAAVCNRADVRLAVVPVGVRASFSEEVSTLVVDEHGLPMSSPSDVDSECRPRASTADQPAYVIFTSGSSGEPKGVAVEHRAARTTIDDVTERFGVGPDDRVLALSALSFDLAIYDLFGVLGAGGAMVLPDGQRQRDPGHWCELIGEHGVTVWNTAPAVLEMLVEYAEADPGAAARMAALRLVLLSGDWIPVTLPDRLRALVPEVRVISLGGATEASIWSIHFPIGTVDPAWRSIPYGRPLRGQFFHILDSDARPVPVGEVGELYIAGDGLAREYIGDPEQTARRFAVHPVLDERLYRTGDLGRWRVDGTIEFLGRADRQVKVRGHRIELGEIETVVNRMPQVRQCVASTVPGADGRPRLVGYVVGRSGDVEAAELTAAVSAQLPEYMVPSLWVPLRAVPLTSNGKVDQERLPNPFRTGDGMPAKDPVIPGATVAGTDDVDGRVEPEAEESGWWLAMAAREAGRRGLGLTIRIEAGTLPAGDALRAAADWSHALRTAVPDEALDVTEQLCAEPATTGLIELSLTAGRQPCAPTDPAALPAASAGSSGEPDVSPGAMYEPRITELFEELVGTGIDATTPFHDLGATSLTLVVAHRRLRAGTAPRLALLDLFTYPTVRALSARIATLDSAGGPASAPPVPDAPGLDRAAPDRHLTAPGLDRTVPDLDLASAAARGRRRAHHPRTRGAGHVAH